MQKCIVVLGMHRSGTSALMGVLNLLGINLGSNLLPPVEDNNPKGFFENNYVFEVNEKILLGLNSSWDDLCLLPENWWNQEYHLNGYKKEIVEIIETEFKDADIFGIKDPKMCRLLPFWSKIFEKHNIKLQLIISLRNPLEVAGSLKERDGFSIEKSLLLWMIYMLEAELYSRNFPRVFTSFDDLLKDPEKTINHIFNTLNFEFPENYQNVKNDLTRFLDINLKHHRVDAEEINKDLWSMFSDYYHILLNFVYEDKISKDELLTIDGIREDVFRLYKYFYNKDVRENKCKRIKKSERAVEEKELAITTIKHQMQAKELQISEIKKETKEKDYHLRNLERLVRVKDQYVRNLEKSINMKDVCIGKLEDMVKDKEVSIGELEDMVGDKESLLNHIYNSRGWRALMVYSRIKERVLPQGSWQRALVRSIVNFLRLHVGERNKNRR